MGDVFLHILYLILTLLICAGYFNSKDLDGEPTYTTEYILWGLINGVQVYFLIDTILQAIQTP